MGVHRRVLATAERYPDGVALEVAGARLTYAALVAAARRIAGAIPAGTARTAIVGHRTAHALCGVLGSLIAGTSYVPIHPGYPPDRASGMLGRARCGAVVVDSTGVGLATAILPTAPPCVVIAEDSAVAAALAGCGHPVVLPGGDVEAGDVGPDAEVNLLFTSGSTGTPRGVRVTHGNLDAFLDAALARYELGPGDRFTQFFELVFDLAGFDLFAAWSVGGTVVVPDRTGMLLPGRFAADAGITVWFSVPSTAALAWRQHALDPGALPGLRYGLFCGEALPADLTAAFAQAAPSAAIDNLYGPTEVTLACTVYRWHAGSPAECESGVVPIGAPLPGSTARVSGDDGRAVAPGEVGELWMAGPQVTPGYLDDPATTDRAFVHADGQRWYRTGDRVRRPVSGPMTYLGRADSQVQVNGYRVEVGEVEAALRAVVSGAHAAVVPFPPGVGRCDALIAFVAGDHDPRAVRRALAERLPYYMVPREVRVLDALPLTPNGKIDRRALSARYAEENG
jgi:amino acid adenylation domain-containing protein